MLSPSLHSVHFFREDSNSFAFLFSGCSICLDLVTLIDYSEQSMCFVFPSKHSTDFYRIKRALEYFFLAD